jgi:hypothetical protein
MNKKPLHTFHIPVMGLAYTIDTPIRLAHYGISSVISIIDDEIIERMRVFYSEKFKMKYDTISVKAEDYRAERITAYLNMVDDIVQEKFQRFKETLAINMDALQNFTSMLPSSTSFKKQLQQFISEATPDKEAVKDYLDAHFSPGSIDVNIMTKIDKGNFSDNKELPIIYNDAHASLRGYAKSKLSSSMILSAGFNPKLLSYVEQFEDFYPDSNEYLKKKIIIKVSDFRSAIIQGNFLAKKGLWVSEYRIESGLNCGGHAFATDGFLLGPILEEFKQKREELAKSSFNLMVSSLKNNNRFVPNEPPAMRITVQGGVGTAEEHQFFLTNYQMDSVGWGSPFLLVPEATSVDSETRQLLAISREDDFYVSNISPLGVPFNTVRGSSNEMLMKRNRVKNRFGSSCPKKFLALNKEYSQQGICTASKKFQDLKLEELRRSGDIESSQMLLQQKEEIFEKSCLCVGLANAAYIENGIKVKGEQQGVVICPGPNLAYFNKEVSLSQMIRHIYGDDNILSDSYRPHVFINELKMYVDFFRKGLSNASNVNPLEKKKWESFKKNILDGIVYYEKMFKDSSVFNLQRDQIFEELRKYKLTVLNDELKN